MRLRRSVLLAMLLVSMLAPVLPARAAAPNAPGTTQTTVSTDQYHLHNSDGSTWYPLEAEGGKALSLTLSPGADSHAVISANADLWTASAGVNQDLGIFVGDQLVAWKESGGFAGTFSPNAAAVQVAVPLSGGNQYVVTLRWKTNRNAPGSTIYAGAGPFPAHTPTFSPTRLTTFMASDSSGVIYSAAFNEQYRLQGSDGVTWQPMTDSAGHRVELQIPPTAAQGMSAIVTVNVDLWTADAGVNQDISIDGGRNWKESGGFAGTFSPNAAMLQAFISSINTVTLSWKTNKNAPNATIYAGAGPLPGAPTTFSPTRITVVLYPSTITQYGVPQLTSQFFQSNSDGTAFVRPVDAGSEYVHTWVELQVPCTVVLTANADLWTETAGYNQDLAIVEWQSNGVTLNPPLILAWKESGGYAGTYSPNAAYVQAVVQVPPGITEFDLRWKTNRPANGATIAAGAGPYPPSGGWTDYSPTSLWAQLTDC